YGRLRRMSADLSAREWSRMVAMFGFILAVNALGWGIYVLDVMPHHFDYQGEGGSRGLGVGLGVAVTAWFLGFRHAFDADHISCIDNTTRKLMADGKRPLGTGFFFSFGHSTIVMAVGVGITIAARVVFGAVVDPRSAYETAGGTAGTLVSAGFLYLIALLNVLALPFLFSGGMMLFDTLDGVFMNFAYGWAFARPVRKVYYNLVITGLSIGAAFIIGTIAILGVLTAELRLNGGFWSVTANFNINVAGFCIAGLFVVVWGAALAYWRFGRVEARWTSKVDP